MILLFISIHSYDFVTFPFPLLFSRLFTEQNSTGKAKLTLVFFFGMEAPQQELYLFNERDEVEKYRFELYSIEFYAY